MKIRPFHISDSESYAHTLLLTLPCESHNEAMENVNIIIERLETEERELWVADVDGEGVGFMLLEFEEAEKNVEIDWFDIHPTQQGRGVGKTLVQKAGERARDRQYATLTIHTAASNQKMCSFAEKNGFSKTACIPEFWGEKTEDAYLFQKIIQDV